jgi:hypothetical protein
MAVKKIMASYAYIIALFAAIFVTSCGTVPHQADKARQEYVYISKAQEVSGTFLGRLVIGKAEQCCEKNKDPHDLTIRQRAVSFRAIALDQPINTTSNAKVGELGYMPPEKDVGLLELAFLSGSDEMAVFDQNIGKKARLTCELRHLDPLNAWGMTKVNCSVLSIELEPWWGF